MLLDELTALLKIHVQYRQLVVEKKDRKAFRKMLVKMRSRVEPIFRSEIVDDILDANDKEVYTVVCNHAQDYLNIVPNARIVSQNGGQGMIVHRDEIFPIVIRVETKEDGQWAKANQAKFELDCISCYMRVFGIEAATVSIILFADKGFSGDLHTYTVDRRVDLIGR